MAARTFLALDVDDATVDAITAASRKLCGLPGKVAWTRPRNIHVTMNFLGDVPEDRLADVCELAGRCAAEVAPFDIDARGLVCVPSGGHDIRMIWANASDPSGRMQRLYDLLNRELAVARFRTEARTFKGHMTVARVKHVPDAGDFRRQVSDFMDSTFGITATDRLTVYTSDLTPQGPVYTVVASLPIGE